MGGGGPRRLLNAVDEGQRRLRLEADRARRPGGLLKLMALRRGRGRGQDRCESTALTEVVGLVRFGCLRLWLARQGSGLLGVRQRPLNAVRESLHGGRWPFLITLEGALAQRLKQRRYLILVQRQTLLSFD
jgi:hypothetical protein